jgi:hypothetical protein
MLQMLPSKILVNQGIIADSETKLKNGNGISGEMKDTDRPVQGYVTSIPFNRLYSRNLKK